MDELTRKFAEMLEKVGAGAEGMWPRILRRVQIDAVGSIVFGGVFLLFSIGMCLFSKYWIRYARRREWTANDEEMIVPIAIALMALVPSFFIGIGMIWSGVVTLIEPTPEVLKLLTGSLGK